MDEDRTMRDRPGKKKIQTVRLYNAKKNKQVGERQQEAHRSRQKCSAPSPHKQNYILKHKCAAYKQPHIGKQGDICTTH